MSSTIYLFLCKEIFLHEGELEEKESRQQGYLSRATAIRAQIAELQLELQEIEEDSSHEGLLKDLTTHFLSSHRGRVNKVTNFKSALENYISKDHDRICQLDKIVGDFETDELVFSKRMYSLHDFVIACASEED